MIEDCRFLYNKDNEHARSLAKKLSNTKPGQIINVTSDEMDVWLKKVDFAIVELPKLKYENST